MSMQGRMMAVMLGLAAAISVLAGTAQASSRIKDVVSFEGVRENQLIGYGLVVGLNGTGDSLRNNPETQQSMQSMLERLGVNTRNATNMDTKNTAAVIVTANLPAFSAAGSQIDVTVSAMGDAKSLLGGTLLVTSMIGADNEVYAVAQGTVQTGAISATGASGSSVTRGVPTQGRVASGATVERETGFQLASMPNLRMTLHNPDFTTAERIAAAVNVRFPGAADGGQPHNRHGHAPEGREHRQLRHRGRAARDRSGRAGQGRDRRGQRRGGDGQRRAHLHRSHSPGQPDHLRPGERRRSVSPIRFPKARRRSRPRARSASTNRRADGWSC